MLLRLQINAQPEKVWPTIVATRVDETPHLEYFVWVDFRDNKALLMLWEVLCELSAIGAKDRG